MKNKQYIVLGAVALYFLLKPNKVKAETIIRKHEGLELSAYLDPIGIPTIGFGTTRNPDTGQKIKMGDTISLATALRWLKVDTDKVRERVKKMVKVPITANQLNALTSFAYNVGTTALLESTLLRLLNNRIDKMIVANEFDRWVYAKGKKLPGLVKRRAEEKQVFLS